MNQSEMLDKDAFKQEETISHISKGTEDQNRESQTISNLFGVSQEELLGLGEEEKFEVEQPAFDSGLEPLAFDFNESLQPNQTELEDSKEKDQLNNPTQVMPTDNTPNSPSNSGDEEKDDGPPEQRTTVQGSLEKSTIPGGGEISHGTETTSQVTFAHLCDQKYRR